MSEWSRDFDTALELRDALRTIAELRQENATLLKRVRQLKSENARASASEGKAMRIAEEAIGECVELEKQVRKLKRKMATKSNCRPSVASTQTVENHLL